MILASLIISGKQRLLLLRSSGEIWPVSTTDVQYIMPSSLIQPSLAETCWSPELVDLWAQGEEASSSEISSAMEGMQSARRQAVMVLRKIVRETERMCGKLMSNIGQSQLGGIEGIWDKWLPDTDENCRVPITSTQAAEFILNAKGGNIVVKPNTLPAYAAHCLLMSRSDLFLADQANMATSGTFMVRSRSERAALQLVTRLVNSHSIEDQAVFAKFIDKARNLVKLSLKLRNDPAMLEEGYTEVKHDYPEWTDEEKTIISVLVKRLYETRSTQNDETEAFAVSIMKLMGVYDKQVLDRAMLPQFLTDIGVLPPWETLKRSEARETEVRAMALAQLDTSSGTGMLQGNELDELRHDFSNHKIFVVDDATASELDDGISIERVPGSDDAWIHVHIADPTRYIPLNSSIATLASFRASSSYLPEGNIPLFPSEVIMKELSLGANVSRDEGRQGTLTFSTKLTPSGEVLDSTVRMGWIKSPRLVTYSSVDKALGVQSSKTTRPLGVPLSLSRTSSKDDDLPAEDVEDLRLIQSFAMAHRSRRLQNAGLEWHTASSSLHIVNPLPSTCENFFDPSQLSSQPAIYSGSPIIDFSVTSAARTFTGLQATSIIAEMMILAGRTASRFCDDRNLPVPYRTSSAPTPTALPGQAAVTLDTLMTQRDPMTKLISPFAIASANLSFAPGDVSFTPGQHWIMGFNDNNGYVRATSPLRRFDDMLVHWQIKSALAREKSLSRSLAPEISQEDMTTLVKRSDATQRKLKKQGNTAQAWWQAGLIASRLRNPTPKGYDFSQGALDILGGFKGYVAGPTIYGTTSSSNTTPITIPALGLTARLPGKGKSDMKVGQEVEVKIKQAEQWSAPIIDVTLA